MINDRSVIDASGVDKFKSRLVSKPETGCLEFRHRNTKNKYGTFSCRSVPHLPHRLAWQLARGPIPVGLRVLHRCDNPPCCNPDHLFLGTQLDNVKDMDSKGRRRPARVLGTAQGMAKLTEDDVRKIRADYQPGKTKGKRVTLTALASKYSVSFALIARVVSRKSWSHVA